MPQDLGCVNSRVAVDFQAQSMHSISNYRGWWGCDASATLAMGQKRQKLAQLSLRRVSGRLRRLAGSWRWLVGSFRRAAGSRRRSAALQAEAFFLALTRFLVATAQRKVS